VSWRYTSTPDTVARLVNDLNRSLAAERVPIEVHGGAEIAATRVGEIDPSDLARFGLAEGPWLLIEPPIAPAVTGLDTVVLSLHGRGHRVLLAHPERCPAFHRDPRMLGNLVDAGVLTSITAGSLVGRFGGRVRRFALKLVHEGMAHSVASDAHDHIKRSPSMRAELEQAGLGHLTDWLTRTMPAAILDGEEIPPRLVRAPVGVTRSRLRWLRPGKVLRAHD
jgi:protein-tyrosine phosphatase